MECLSGLNLVKKDGSKITSEEALKEKDVIGFYFSAHWCPPCRMFTPVLADMYNEVTESNNSFEIIFVSSDHTEAALFEYMKECHGDWLAVPYGSPAIQNISSKYEIRGIPSLVIVKKDGTLITTNGRTDVQNKGPLAFSEWSK